jgi:hypothetical protein
MTAITVRITTTDTDWITRNGFDTADNGDALIPVDTYETLTFAKVPMVRFDMKAVTKRMPRDWMNRWTMLPAAHIVTA